MPNRHMEVWHLGVSYIQAPFEGACVTGTHATIAEKYRCMSTAIDLLSQQFDLEHELHESRLPQCVCNYATLPQ